MSGQRRRTHGSRWMHLHYDGTCKICGTTVPQGAHGYYDDHNRTITCTGIDCAQADNLVRYDEATDQPILADTRDGDPAPAAFNQAGTPV